MHRTAPHPVCNFAHPDYVLTYCKLLGHTVSSSFVAPFCLPKTTLLHFWRVTAYTVGMSTAQQIQSANRTHLAKELGLCRYHVVKVLNGKAEPSLSVAAALARKLGISLDELYRHIQKSALVN